jgi:uncharacterized protein (TIGR01244 family)
LVAAIGVALAVSVGAQSQVTKENVPGVRNFSRVETTVACAGATGPEAMPAIKKMGFASVINLRQANEEGANIPEAEAAAKAAGLTYVHIPFNAQAPDPAVVDNFIKAVSAPANQPAYVHCASANRASALWMIKRVQVDKWDVDRAQKEAEALGLTSQPLKDFALNYIQTHKS